MCYFQPATKTSTGSLDQQAGFIVDSVLANITLEQLSLAAEKPKMKSTGSIATDTEDDMVCWIIKRNKLKKTTMDVFRNVVLN